ncbi:MAG: hypothetical protein DHS20C18_23710 [Saprospiraceae bacterium]|nr:MAG: hypothetical protein DHS20C18_23710 [Saprospiraceae bacterium]
MKTIALNLALIILSALFMTACEKETFKIVPSNNIISKQHAITDFNELDISGPFKVYVTFSATEQGLRIEANDNLHGIIEVEQNNGRLSVKLKNRTTIQNGGAVLNVFVTTNDIETINAQGAAEIYLQNQWNEDRVAIELEGACSFKGSLAVNQLNAKLVGASDLEIEGSADHFDIEAEGASNMEGFDFETDHLSADLKGGCNVSLTVHDKLNVQAVGASNVYYKGSGVIENQNLTGGSQIKKMD